MIKNKLYEGLYMSYPLQTAYKYLCDLDFIKYVKIRTNAHHNKIIMIQFYNKNLNNVYTALNLLGYYISNYNKQELNSFSSTKLLSVYIEPKYDYEFIPDDSEYNFYHISLSKYDNKILKNGLQPTSKNNIHKYPDRLYVFKYDRNPYNDNFKSIVKKIIKQLYNVSNFNGNINYSVWKINKNVNNKFYSDIHLEQGVGYYTLNPISIKYLDKIYNIIFDGFSFKINELNEMYNNDIWDDEESHVFYTNDENILSENYIKNINYIETKYRRNL